MEFKIIYDNGTMTLREPFFPTSKRNLRKILPLLLIDSMGDDVKEQMATYCESKYNELRLELNASYHDGATKREIQHWNAMAKKATRYKMNAEVIRG